MSTMRFIKGTIATALIMGAMVVAANATPSTALGVAEATGLSEIDAELKQAQCEGGKNPMSPAAYWLGFDEENRFFSKPQPCPGFEGTFTPLYGSTKDHLCIHEIQWHGPGTKPTPVWGFWSVQHGLMETAMYSLPDDAWDKEAHEEPSAHPPISHPNQFTAPCG